MNLMKALDTGSRSGHHSDRHDTVPGRKHRGHFRFNTISALVLLLFIALGLGFQGLIADLPAAEEVSYVAAGVIGAAAVLFIIPYWPMVIAIIGANRAISKPRAGTRGSAAPATANGAVPKGLATPA